MVPESGVPVFALCTAPGWLAFWGGDRNATPTRTTAARTMARTGLRGFGAAVRDVEREEAVHTAPKLRWAARSIGKKRGQFVMGLRKC